MTKNSFAKGHRNFVDIEIITRTFSGGMHGKDNTIENKVAFKSFGKAKNL